MANSTSTLGDRFSTWGPLKQELFRVLWLASIVSNLGTWMQNVGGTWLMTSLSTSPLLTALMQAATSLPVFLVGVIAGAVADIFDRRRLLLITQWGMLLAAALLGVLTLLDLTTPSVLLALTFALGLGAAMNAPVWQAVLPEIVGRSELSSAVALNGVGFNIARAIGPALGGIAVATLGPASVFIINALSFVAVIVVVQGWKRPVVEQPLPTERLFGAIRAGVRFVKHSPLLHFIFIRSAAFIIFASGIWSLLPVVTVQTLKMGAAGYGLLLGCLGVGSLLGAVLLPTARRRWSIDGQIIAAVLTFGSATIALGVLTNIWLLCAAMILAGIAWLQFMATMNVATQSVAPHWVQARAMGFYLLVVQGCLAIGSTLWGLMTVQVGTQTTLIFAGTGLFLSVAAVLRFPLHGLKSVDLSPGPPWPEPELSVPLEPEAGPVMVEVEYHVKKEFTGDFTRAMYRLKRIRLRDGAIRWELYRDLGTENRFIENFVIESWAEHLRQHARTVGSDRELKVSIYAMLVDGKTTRVAHYICSHPVPLPSNPGKISELDIPQ